MTLRNFLMSAAKNLSNGLYVGSKGEHSCLLIHENDKEKKEIIRSFCNECTSKFKNIIPIVIEAKNNEQFANNTIFTHIEQELKNKWNIKVPEEVETSTDGTDKIGTGTDLTSTDGTDKTAIINTLQNLSPKKRILLIIDDLDKLYEMDPKLFPNCSISLWELAYLSNRDTGLFYVILSGKHDIINNLINGDINYSIKYPLIFGSPKLHNYL